MNLKQARRKAQKRHDGLEPTIPRRLANSSQSSRILIASSITVVMAHLQGAILYLRHSTILRPSSI